MCRPCLAGRDTCTQAFSLGGIGSHPETRNNQRGCLSLKTRKAWLSYSLPTEIMYRICRPLLRQRRDAVMKMASSEEEEWKSGEEEEYKSGGVYREP
jgi:hypothetical protein